MVEKDYTGLGIVGLVVLGVAFLAYLIHNRAQKNYKATTTTEYNAAGRPVKIEEKVTWL